MHLAPIDYPQDANDDAFVLNVTNDPPIPKAVLPVAAQQLAAQRFADLARIGE